MRESLFVIGLLLFNSLAWSQDAKPDDVQKRVAELIESMATSDYAGKAATDKLVEIGRPAVDQLLLALKSPTVRVRYWSAAVLGRIGDERAYAPLVELVRKDSSGFVRSTALWYLQHFPREEVWNLAIEMLDDKSMEVRGWAIKLLAEKKRTEALPKLKEVALKSGEFKTRYDAMVAVAKIADDESLDTLRAVLKGDPEVTVRKGALSCLTILKKKEPVILALMIDALEDDDAEVREFASMLLRKGANQDFHFESSGTPEARAEAVKAWRKWYEANKEKLKWDEGKRRFTDG